MASSRFVTAGQPTNEELQYAFKKLNGAFIRDIKADLIIDFLFGERVLSADDNLALGNISCREAKARKLLALLHAGEHPEGFLRMYQFLKEQGSYRWLIEEIDKICVNGADAASDVVGSRQTSLASNEMLKDAFLKLNVRVIGIVNVDSTGDYLFSVNVLNETDNLALSGITDRAEKTRKLMAILHAGKHPLAFVELRDAIGCEVAYSHLVDKVDKLLCHQGVCEFSVIRGL